MGGVGGVKWAGLFLALLLALSVVSALSLQSDPDRESERERRRERDREREREVELESDRHRGRRGEGERGRELQLEKPREWFRSEGGHLRVWDNIRALEDANVDVQTSRFTLRERGLVLPKYDDAACIGYVEEGEGLVGYLTGYALGERVRRVKRGDVVAFPRGIAHWWYNSGNQELRILALADTSSGLRPGEVTIFSLVGGRGGEEGRRERRGEREAQEELGSILHGFRTEFLAEAWDVEEREVEELLNSQRGVGIVRAEREIDVRHLPRDEDANTGTAQQGESGVGALAGKLGDFVYNVREGTPDVRVENAGHSTVVNSFKLPILQHVNLGLAHSRLERNAILAPHWSPSGHRVLHILEGNGRLEIAGNAGQRLVSSEVQEGDVYVIPRFHPAGIRAGESGLEWISFYTTNLPYVEALAGKTSVFKNLPVQVSAAAFNIDEERVRELRKRRLRDAILLPPRGQRERRDEDVVQDSIGVAAL